MHELDEMQVRVLGCLLEKERTVPDSYPMTLNALVTACNQTTNRAPIVSYAPGDVQRTLDRLKDEGLVRFVHPSHGERTTKFRQVIDEKLALLPTEAAVLSILFVRGPQTVAEIRSRTERLHRFDDNEEVQAALDGLAARDEPLVRAVGRQWTHVFAQSAVPAPPAPAVETTARSALEDRIAALEHKVDMLFSLLGEDPPTL